MKRNAIPYTIALVCLAYYFIFCYAPMGGILIAFKNYKPTLGVFGSPWVGFKYFEQFFTSYFFGRLIRNTLLINLYDLLIGFPAPIILALLFNELASSKLRRVAQTVTYLPHFISQVVICGILLNFLASNGLFNQIIKLFGGQPAPFLQDPAYFRTIFVGSGIWQGVGYGTILYLSALSGVDKQLLDAAAIDGCNRFRRVWHVTLPAISPTIIIMLILRVGSMMNVGFEKIILLYNPSLYETADVISSFVYRYGLLEGNFGYSTAVGLFNSVINFALLILVNHISKRVSEISLL
jgi:putative aldouronate transport system permease protein